MTTTLRERLAPDECLIREVDPAPRSCVRDDPGHVHQPVGALGRYLRADGTLTWVTIAPVECTNGHPLVGGDVAVTGGPGYKPPTWTCRTCGDVTSAP